MQPFAIKPVFGAIYLAQFTEQTAMASTMLRFQEHYESPHFRSLVFTREEFEKRYAKQFGSFTYLTDWTGFNVPSSVLEPFIQGKFNPLSDQEAELLSAVAHLDRPFYLIAAADEADTGTLRHEVAHGLYFTNPDYRSEVHHILEHCQLAPIHRWLRSGYHYATWLDECHAYLMANYDDVLVAEGVLKDGKLREASQTLIEIFDYYTRNKFIQNPK